MKNNLKDLLRIVLISASLIQFLMPAHASGPNPEQLHRECTNALVSDNQQSASTICTKAEQAWKNAAPLSAWHIASVSNLASLAESQGKHKEAQALNLKALQMYESSGMKDLYLKMMLLVDIVDSYKQQKDYDRALPYLNQLVEASLRNDQGEIRGWISTRVDQFVEYYGSNKMEEKADALILSVLDAHEKVSGLTHPKTMDQLRHVVMYFDDDGPGLKIAETLLLREISQREKALPPDNETIWKCRFLLGTVYFRSSQREKAVTELQKYLQYAENKPSLKDTDLFKTLYILAYDLTLQGRYPDAESLLKRALTVAEDLYGGEADSEQMVKVLSGVAEIYKDHKNFSEADRLIRKAIAIMEKAKRPDQKRIESLRAKLSKS